MAETALQYRSMIADARRVVVKIGSRVLVQKTGRPDVRRMRLLVRDLARLRRDGYDVVVVTSGAVGAGMEALGMTRRPQALPDIQMAAAVGQVRLMKRYHDFFEEEDCRVGQMLLTHDDFFHALRFTNARRTMENLLRNKVVPVVNENDVVAVEELRAEIKKLGDNDLLAALVAKMIRADLLIMLTTVNGYMAARANGAMRRVSILESVNRAMQQSAGAAKGSEISIGGINSKLKAAQMAARAGCYVVIANGRASGVIPAIMRGADVGTLIPATPLGN